MKKIIIPALSLVIAIVFYACDTRTYDDLTPQVPVTYNNTVKIIMDKNCVSCHSPSGQDDSPYLTNYTEVKENVDAIIAAMKSTTNPMPPNGLLPAATVAKIEAWKAAGMPEN